MLAANAEAQQGHMAISPVAPAGTLHSAWLRRPGLQSRPIQAIRQSGQGLYTSASSCAS